MTELGKRRGIGFGIVLYIVTVGIYGAYWLYVTFDELKRHNGRGLGGGVALLLWVVSIVLAFPVLILSFLAPQEIGPMYERAGKEPPVSGWTGLWIFPFGILIVPAIVWWVKVQGALNRYWEPQQSERHAVSQVSG